MKAAFLAVLASVAFTGMNSASAAVLTVDSYDMINGNGQAVGGTYNYWDGNYNGTGSTTTDNAPLAGGTGALTDGFIETQPWYLVSNNSGTGTYVGWFVPVSGNPLITFHLAGTPTVNSVDLFVDNSNIGGVGAPGTITIDGTTYTPTVTAISATSEKLTVSGLSLLGGVITVQPNRVGPEPWIFVSEAQFAGVSGVPEASTWAMMLLGFVGLGLTYGRKRRNALA
jgi:hypothetical protein